VLRNEAHLSAIGTLNLATDLRRNTLQTIVPMLCVGMHEPTLRVIERRAFRYAFLRGALERDYILFVSC